MNQGNTSDEREKCHHSRPEPTIHETDEYGNCFQWKRERGVCPECGASCFHDRGLGATPDRIYCEACGYRKGYEYRLTEGAQYLDMH